MLAQARSPAPMRAVPAVPPDPVHARHAAGNRRRRRGDDGRPHVLRRGQARRHPRQVHKSAAHRVAIYTPHDGPHRRELPRRRRGDPQAARRFPARRRDRPVSRRQRAALRPHPEAARPQGADAEDPPREPRGVHRVRHPLPRRRAADGRTAARARSASYCHELAAPPRTNRARSA